MKSRKVLNKSDKTGSTKSKSNNVKKKAIETTSTSMPSSPAILNTSPAINTPEESPVIEAHRIMMNNAMFLLELGSAAGTGM